jgi:hypothetical protein
MPSLGEVVANTALLNRGDWENLSRAFAEIEKDSARFLTGSWRGSKRFQDTEPDVLLDQVRQAVEGHVQGRLSALGFPLDLWMIQAVLVPDASDPESIADWEVKVWYRSNRPSTMPPTSHDPTISEKTGPHTAVNPDACGPGCRCGMDRGCPAWKG